MMQLYTAFGEMVEDSDCGYWYRAADADARHAEMRKAFETSSTDEENKLRAELADSNEALAACQMQASVAVEARDKKIVELEKALMNATVCECGSILSRVQKPCCHEKSEVHERKDHR